MKVSEVYVQVDVILNLLEIAEKILVSGMILTNDELMQVIGKPVLNIFPDIVDTYDHLQVEDKKEQMDFWCGQMNRVIDALSGNDRFFLLDVLLYETRESLLQYKRQVEICQI